MSQYPPSSSRGQSPPPSPELRPAGAYTMGPAARTGNGLAVASLVCGFLFCIPAITGILAVAFGLAGFSRGKDPRRGGRGMAMAGMILGVLSLIGWSGAGYFAYWGYGQIKAFLVPTTGLFETLGKNDIQGARQYVTASVTDADLTNAQSTFSTMGEFTRFDNPNFTQSAVNGVTTYTLTGKAVFARGSSNVTISFDKDPKGVIKVSQLKAK